MDGIDKNEMQRSLNQKTTMDCITSTSSLTNDDSVEHGTPTKKKSMWNDQW